MKGSNLLHNMSKAVLSLFFWAAVFSAGISRAEQIAPAVQANIDQYKKNLVEWAANPLIVNAAKLSNSRGGITAMSNSKWDELNENDPAVVKLSQNTAAKQIAKWEASKTIEKLNLRDYNANLVAFSSLSGKPLLYNTAGRPSFQNGFKGAWAANEVKPDPTTQKKTVQISAPVMDGGKTIGVLHSAVLAE